MADVGGPGRSRDWDEETLQWEPYGLCRLSAARLPARESREASRPSRRCPGSSIAWERRLQPPRARNIPGETAGNQPQAVGAALHWEQPRSLI